MPFTFSHPAIVLPATYLPKKWYSLSALIIGSITPDFEYFIRMRDYSRYSHTVKGIFWFDLPLSLILIFIFHNVIRDTIIEYLPLNLNRRFSAFANFNWNKYFIDNKIVVLISLFVGIVSHFLWDGFTHRSAAFVAALPFLSKPSAILNHHHIYIYSLVRYLNSIAGGIIICIAVWKLPKGIATRQNSILNFWLLVLLIMITIANLKLYIVKRHFYYDDKIVLFISGMLIGITILSVLLKEPGKQQMYQPLQQTPD